MRRYLWVGLLFGLALAGGYRPVSVAEVALGRAPTGRVRVFGRYLAFFPTTQAVDGVLAGPRYALLLEGEVFDRRPEPGRYLEVWGELVRGRRGFLLRFHNFRYPNENRRPRPAGLAVGGTGAVWLRVYPVAGPGEPPAGVSEDRQVFRLPGYRGPFGVVCLIVTRKAAGILTDARPCSGR